MKIENTEVLQIIPISNLSELDQSTVDSVATIYQRAFEKPPYQESFTNEEAVGAMKYILDKSGDVIIGQSKDGVVSLAGGYIKNGCVYYIEELAVNPDQQGLGFGRITLQALINIALERDPRALEIRTTIRNDKAINLYESEGFIKESVSEVVAQARQDGKLALDERVYLFKEIKELSMENPSILKRTAIVYPSGNTTAVVFDQMLDADREQLNAQVMEAWKRKSFGEPEIEQCCFVTIPKDLRTIARVEMFGGEFCGNATRSVIQLITEGKDYQGLIEVSGVDRPLNFNARNGSVAVEMPLPQTGELYTDIEEGTLVRLDGIVQIVVTKEEQQDKITPRKLLTELVSQNKYGLAEEPAVGVSFFDAISNKSEFSVWVKEVNTIFDETACGSGTCAIGIVSALQKQQNQRLEIIQPSGEIITTETVLDGDANNVIASYISGNVTVLYDGELTLS